MVRILVFVDHDIAEFLLIIVPHVLVLLQQLDRQQDDIVKIHGAGCLAALGIGRVDLGDLFQTVVPCCGGLGGKFVRLLQLVLCLADEG